MTPRVTFVLLSYNQQETAAAAAMGALDQDYPNLEVVISDDASKDETFARLKEVCSRHSGGHDVRLRRSETNGGLLRNLRAAVEGASGDLIVIAAADDLSHPTRVSELTHAWVQAGLPKAAVVYSDVRPIDGSGRVVENWTEKVAAPPFTIGSLAEGKSGPLGAACAITPALLDEPQPIDSTVVHEDRVFPFRALLLGGAVLYVDKPLVDYRVEGGISRYTAASRWEHLTALTEKHMRRTIPDARQRLADAVAVRAPKTVVKRCRQVLVEQETYLRMAQGRNLVPTALTGVLSGARLAKVGAHLLRLLRAAVIDG